MNKIYITLLFSLMVTHATFAKNQKTPKQVNHNTMKQRVVATIVVVGMLAIAYAGILAMRKWLPQLSQSHPFSRISQLRKKDERDRERSTLSFTDLEDGQLYLGPGDTLL